MPFFATQLERCGERLIMDLGVIQMGTSYVAMHSSSCFCERKDKTLPENETLEQARGNRTARYSCLIFIDQLDGIDNITGSDIIKI